jgi:hypothetical protein
MKNYAKYPIFQLLNPLSLELPSEFHKGEDDCGCNLNCKDRGKDHHGCCQQIERKKAKKKEESRLRASSRQELHLKSAVGFMWDN